MIKKCLAFVPHQDDEINLLGCIIGSLKRQQVYITVVFSTNGDMNDFIAPVRFNESKKVMKDLGIDKEIYMGYGDCLQGEHLYHSFIKPVISEATGFSQTYTPSGYAEYRYLRHKQHGDYNRKDFEEDIREIILEEMAELIICVDCDKHPDHRALSLSFDRVMGGILKCTDYCPIILKKFAYLGTWNGPGDYFRESIMAETQFYDVVKENADCTPYEWNDRIRISVEPELYPVKFWKSDVFKALFHYKSVAGIRKFINIVNSDSVFWWRRTDNLVLKANIQVSSGDKDFLNDFMLIDFENIVDKKNNYCECCWFPDSNDSERKINIKFDTIKSIRYICIHKNITGGKINKIAIALSDGYEQEYKTTERLYETYDLGMHNVDHIELKIISSNGVAGIREIEVLNNLDFDFSETPFESCSEKNVYPRNRNMSNVYACMYEIAVRCALVRKKGLIFFLRCKRYLIKRFIVE